MLKKPIYRIDINYHEYGFIDIQAISADQARAKAIRIMSEEPGKFYANNSDFDTGDICLNP